MSVINVAKMGDPCLAMKAKPVNDFKNDELQKNVSDMIDTMRYYQGVGLAAPQIHLSQQIIVLEVTDNARYPEAQPIALDILINPEILVFSQQQEADWEGCLSLPGMRGRVLRSESITYQAMNLAGESIKQTVNGFHARIIQHEIDHLNGILYPQRIEGLSDFGFEESLPAFQQTEH
ncbi:MAG: peptide deformylase [gamma proteobacterium symbiont of Bathyaustriella thionipta]|nr:peptide deformylase [gamma proteobacterium symbiont of Bathyaustriella thionipta]MCU7949845.1 peptide deformylase [gamma proteobacterium symbiont of Bathyaustriella thionipta]MCU7954603.1 peptide deformylase [gamma proteobacterium symbiont of Bathyaustriella thionipta]MCU7956536.1 peptide deformylase [gamma proteobacterium symbiont of Bathyaustriella thionipta]MCU7966942.1 peptide deformylase [gamma proteobacterium symbiont of Bathyaustriella thionipta]